MKTICSIFLIIILLLIESPKSIVGRYQIKSNQNFSTIELKNDSTFIYKNRGISTWTWSTFEGKWSHSQNILTLKQRTNNFDPNKYLSREYQKHNIISKEIKYHKYKSNQKGLIAFPENELDAKMEFHKIN